jgi:hypothetical protein
MALPCSICTHKERKAIEAALIARQSMRRIAAQYGMGEASVRRHKQNCLVGKVERKQEKREAAALLTIAQKQQLLWRVGSGILGRRLQAGDDREARCMLAELRQQVALQAELSAPDDGRDQWVKLRECIWHALQPFPDALQAVMTAIAPLEEETALVDAGG